VCGNIAVGFRVWYGLVLVSVWIKIDVDFRSFWVAMGTRYVYCNWAWRGIFSGIQSTPLINNNTRSSTANRDLSLTSFSSSDDAPTTCISLMEGLLCL
jgi:hypothetical protein